MLLVRDEHGSWILMESDGVTRLERPIRLGWRDRVACAVVLCATAVSIVRHGHP